MCYDDCHGDQSTDFMSAFKASQETALVDSCRFVHHLGARNILILSP